MLASAVLLPVIYHQDKWSHDTTTMLQLQYYNYNVTIYSVTIYNTMTTFYLYNSVQPYYTLHTSIHCQSKTFGRNSHLDKFVQKISTKALPFWLQLT